MADFCKTCSIELFGDDCEDLAGLAEPGFVVSCICEGCGPTVVNNHGECYGACLEAGKLGHGGLFDKVGS